MYRIDPVVAIKAFDRVIAGIAVASEDLDGEFVGLQPVLRAPGLANRRKKFEQQMGLVAFLPLRRGPFLVDQPRRVQAQGQAALDDGFLSQQHPPHIRMFDDHDLAGVGIALVGVAALWALRRIGQRMSVPGIGHGHGSQADLEAGFVHHVKHLRETAIRLTDELTDAVTAFAKIQQAVDDPALPHLVVQAGEYDVIVFVPAAAVCAQARNEEQRDAFYTLRRIGQFGQYEVNDVLG